MSVYKEGYNALHQLQNNQRQIWSGSCDFGTPVQKKSAMWNLAVQLVEWYGIQKQVINPAHTEAIVCLMNEWAYSDDESPNKSEDKYTEYYKITYIVANFESKAYDGYFQVEKITDKEDIKKYKKIAEEKYNKAA